MCVEAHAKRVASLDPLLCSQTRVYAPLERLSAAENPSRPFHQVLPSLLRFYIINLFFFYAVLLA